MTIISKLRTNYRPIAVLGLTLMSANLASAAAVTFAQYFQTNGTTQQWTVSNSGTTTTVMATGSVLFNFSGVSVPFAGAETATFTLSATSNQPGNCGVACGAGDSFVEPGFSGTFSFIDAQTAPGTNLLSGTFAVTGSPSTTGAQFSSHIGSSGGSFDASATSGNLNQLIFTSDYLSFLNQDTENASWSLSSLVPNFQVGTVTAGQAFPAGAFHASGTGTFSSNPGPTSAPEPGSVLMIGGGLCAVAVSMRRRIKAVA